MLTAIKEWCFKNELRLWFLGICLIGIVVFAAFVILIRPATCKNSIGDQWTSESYEYSYPQYYGAEKRSETITEKKKSSYSHDDDSYDKYAESAYEVICGEIKFGDLAIAFLTYCLVAVGWFTMRSADENTRTAERAYLVGGPFFGQPNGRPNPWKMENRALASMFEGPWYMTIYNFGRTAGYSTKFEWGLCPVGKFPLDMPVSKLIDKGRLKEWMQPPTEVQYILKPTDRGIPFQISHISIDDREKYVNWVYFGRITYLDIFRQQHYTTFSYHICPEHSVGIGQSLSHDHT